MHAKHLSLVILCLFLLSGPVFAQGGDEALLVRVREADGRPVKYACVTVIPKDGEILFHKADGKGRVRFKGVAKGHYRIVVKADGYAAQKREVAVGGGVETVEFSMQPREVQ